MELSTKVKKDNYHLWIFVHTGKTGDKAKETVNHSALKDGVIHIRSI
jgi:hypothetical protein